MYGTTYDLRVIPGEYLSRSNYDSSFVLLYLGTDDVQTFRPYNGSARTPVLIFDNQIKFSSFKIEIMRNSESSVTLEYKYALL